MRKSPLEIITTTPATNRSSEAVDHQIDKVVQQISVLSIELKDLRSQQKAKKKRTSKKRDEGERSDTEIDRTTRDGTRVVITSNHKNRKGLTGTIIRKTQCQAVVQTIIGEFRVNFANLKHLD